MEDADKKLLELVHQSGFPFQIGVRKQIEAKAGEHGWVVSAEEYHWTHPGSGRTGFIDLIVEHQTWCFSLVIECKRVRAKDPRDPRGPSWIFLAPSTGASVQGRLSGLKAIKNRDPEMKGSNSDELAWTDDVDFYPPSIEPAYCVFETQDERSPMIEKIADSLLPSVEAVAADWFTHTDVSNYEQRVFLPVIVTNATLYTCTFDAAKIGMADGNLHEADFKPVPFVRFRKGLTQVKSGERCRNFKHANRQQQRTLLIVNATSMADTLKQIITR